MSPRVSARVRAGLAVKPRLKQIQHRPDLVDGCLVGAGLIRDD
ncbi:hypothetical protein OG625_37810 [Streptomyces sp. NBC_01351]|nr:hypothetical protein [Streptomyces sp. NBC_01351]